MSMSLAGAFGDSQVLTADGQACRATSVGTLGRDKIGGGVYISAEGMIVGSARATVAAPCSLVTAISAQALVVRPHAVGERHFRAPLADSRHLERTRRGAGRMVPARMLEELEEAHLFPRATVELSFKVTDPVRCSSASGSTRLPSRACLERHHDVRGAAFRARGPHAARRREPGAGSSRVEGNGEYTGGKSKEEKKCARFGACPCRLLRLTSLAETIRSALEDQADDGGEGNARWPP